MQRRQWSKVHPLASVCKVLRGVRWGDVQTLRSVAALTSLNNLHERAGYCLHQTESTFYCAASALGGGGVAK